MSAPGKTSSPFEASVFGMLRTAVVSIGTHPCDVIKIRMRTADEKKNLRQTISSLYKEKGVLGFYTAYRFRLLKLLPQQAISWPLMIEVPRFIQSNWQGKIGPQGQQVITACTISLVNAGLTPFRNIVILSNAEGKIFTLFSFVFSREGWKGAFPNFCQSFLSYGSFLCYQQFYLDLYRRITKKERLSTKELCGVGLAVGGSVGMTMIGIDAAYDLRVARNLPMIRQIFEEQNRKRLIRGAVPYFTSLAIHNVASILLLEYLKQR